MCKDGSELLLRDTTRSSSTNSASLPLLSLAYLPLPLTHFFSCEVFRFVGGVLGDVLAFV